MNFDLIGGFNQMFTQSDGSQVFGLFSVISFILLVFMIYMILIPGYVVTIPNEEKVDKPPHSVAFVHAIIFTTIVSIMTVFIFYIPAYSQKTYSAIGSNIGNAVQAGMAAYNAPQPLQMNPAVSAPTTVIPGNATVVQPSVSSAMASVPTTTTVQR